MTATQRKRRARFTGSRSFWALVVGVILGLAWIFQRHFALVVVVGSSMQPTFDGGDILIVDRQAYQQFTPQRGEIVIARKDADTVVKRVVGLPGEKIEIWAGALIVDGKNVAEAYSVRKGSLTIKEGRLGRNRFGLVGDNRGTAGSTTAVIAGTHEFVGRVLGCVPLTPKPNQQ
ncbi:MAG: signal peptidase I [Limisphaerales bacterium]|jgi:signal peptidase I